jgi:hypothetical protein
MDWSDRLPELMERLGDAGLVFLVKMDGEREHKRWTVVVTGKPLTERPIRVDGNTLQYCLKHALQALRAAIPTLPDLD